MVGVIRASLDKPTLTFLYSYFGLILVKENGLVIKGQLFKYGELITVEPDKNL